MSAKISILTNFTYKFDNYIAQNCHHSKYSFFFTIQKINLTIFATMNVPNTLTVIRILVAITVPFYVINGSLEVRLIAGIICTVAVLTDWLDGWYARKYNAVTNIGKILDPIADKVFVITCLSVLAYVGVISIWWVVPIILREIIVTVYRFIFIEKGKIIAAVKSGKIKTAMQMSTIAVAYVIFLVKKHFVAYFHTEYYLVLYCCLAITLYLTLESGYVFFRNNWKLVLSVHKLDS